MTNTTRRLRPVICNDTECQRVLIPNSTEEVEAEIDRHIDPERITDDNVNAYNRVEITRPAKSEFWSFCASLNGDGYFYAIYDEDSQDFIAELDTYCLYIRIPLRDVVSRKWKTGTRFTEALLMCANDFIPDDKVKERSHWRIPDDEILTD